MLRSWHLSNFKSVAGPETLELAPITVFAGPNSSGKSTVLQSVLLVAQSLASKVQARHVTLNGDLVKLGTFQDVLTALPGRDHVEIGFHFEAPIGESSSHASYPMLASLRHMWLPLVDAQPDATVGVGVHVAFDSPAPSAEDGVARNAANPVVKWVRLGLSLGSSGGGHPQRSLFRDSAEPEIEIHRRTDEEVAAIAAPTDRVAAPALLLSTEDLRYGIKLRSAARRFLLRYSDRDPEDPERLAAVAARLEHFLPRGFIERVDAVAASVPRLIRDLTYLPRHEVNETLIAWERNAENPILVATAYALREYLSMSTIAGPRAPSTNANPARRLSLLRQDHDARHRLIETVRSRVSPVVRDLKVLQPMRDSEGLEFLRMATESLFRSMRYLGPLRDDPKPIYSASGQADPTDVGVKGQFTAAVLDLHASVVVKCVAPQKETLSSAYLRDAVNDWMSYFSIASTVETVDRGKLGHEVRITPTGGGVSVDLTNVGVGVSQLLPIVVMTLIARPGAILVFEQPELHLHPAVQSLLADFFIAQSCAGKQFMIETHSEYLINRLRLRIAQERSSRRLQDKVLLYFVERDAVESRFTRVRINEYGAIPNWPSGFFDQGPSESERILEAAAAKRRSESRRG